MPERAFDYDQPHNLIAAASWKLGAWSVGARFRYASGLLHTPIVGSVYLADKDFYEPVYGHTNGERMEASHQLDLRVDRRFQFDAWRLSAYLDVTNVYANPRVIDYSYEFDYSKREPLTDLPILPTIGLRGEFRPEAPCPASSSTSPSRSVSGWPWPRRSAAPTSTSPRS